MLMSNEEVELIISGEHQKYLWRPRVIIWEPKRRWWFNGKRTERIAD